MDPEIKGSPPGLSFLMPRQVQDGPPLSVTEGLFAAYPGPLEASLRLPVHIPFSQDHWSTLVIPMTSKWASESPCEAYC